MWEKVGINGCKWEIFNLFLLLENHHQHDFIHRRLHLQS